MYMGMLELHIAGVKLVVFTGASLLNQIKIEGLEIQNPLFIWTLNQII